MYSDDTYNQIDMELIGALEKNAPRVLNKNIDE